MLRLPITQIVQKVGRELTKPKPNNETTTLATGTRIHYVDFDKIRKYKELEMKTFPKGSAKGTPYDGYSAPFKK